MEARFDQQIRAEEARKKRKSATNQILQTGGVLSSKNARAITRERADLEAQRELDREIAWEKRYTKALIKAFKQTKRHRDLAIYRRKGMRNRWKAIFKELVEL